MTDDTEVVLRIEVGVVTFDGVVAGTRYVVVLGDDGLSATYGMLASSSTSDGARVRVGEVIARTGSRLYFGLRRDDTYLDPERYLGVVRHRPRLIPSSGLPGRPSRPMPPTCPAALLPDNIAPGLVTGR